jgi:hypothetical protein
MLLGLLQFCSIQGLESEIKIISEDYKTLYKLLDDEKDKLISKGLNPIDFHPMPIYAFEGTPQEIFKERMSKLKDYLRK